METRQAARAIGLVRRTAKMVGRDIPHVLVFTRTNAAFQTSDERDVRAELVASGVRLLDVNLVRRAADTRIFRDASTLSELREQRVSNIDGAISNARAYAQAVVGGGCEISVSDSTRERFSTTKSTAKFYRTLRPMILRRLAWSASAIGASC